jgi:diamine N-acetyltransferase
MSVTIRPLTLETWDECINLKVRDDQTEFVASNLYSIAEAQFYPGTVCRAIYTDEIMVGFLMYGPDAGYSPEDERDTAYAIVRLMIDQAHQGNGYGYAAMLAAIHEIKSLARCQYIYLSFTPDNIGAERLYRHLGFLPTGAIADGEIVFRLLVTTGPSVRPASHL